VVEKGEQGRRGEVASPLIPGPAGVVTRVSAAAQDTRPGRESVGECECEWSDLGWCARALVAEDRMIWKATD